MGQFKSNFSFRNNYFFLNQSKFFATNLNIIGTSIPSNDFTLLNSFKNVETSLNNIVQDQKNNNTNNLTASSKIISRQKRSKNKIKKHINFRFKQFFISHKLFHLRRKKKKK